MNTRLELVVGEVAAEMVKPSGGRLVGMREWIEINSTSYCCAHFFRVALRAGFGGTCLPRLSAEVGSTRLSSSVGMSAIERSKGYLGRELLWMAFLSLL